MQDVRGVNPLAIFGESARAWAGCLLPTVAFSCVSVFFARLLRLNILDIAGSTNVTSSKFIFLIADVVVFVAANSLASLLILSFIRFFTDGKKVISLREAAGATARALPKYLSAVLLLLSCAAAVLAVGTAVLTFGNRYCTTCGVSGLKLAALLGSGTFFVVMVIAMFWYGFYFSLAPLVGGFEGLGAVASARESRRRVKKQPGAYLAALALFAALYILVGVVVYFTLTRFTSERFVLNMIDPALAALLGPLWLAVWYTSYRKLSSL